MTRRRAVRGNGRERVEERGERRDRASQLVDDDLEPLAVAHPERSAIRDAARAAAARTESSGSARAGSTCRSSPGRPTLPSATSAFRRSQRGSFFGTYSRSSSPISSGPSRVSQSVSETTGWASSPAVLPGPALLDAAVPRAHVLADVASVDAVVEPVHDVVRHLARRLRPVGEAPRRVEDAGLVEGVGGAGVDAERAGAAARRDSRRGLDLDVRDERPEHDPGPVCARDEHRVLADEPDAGALGSRAVDMVVRVDENAVGAAEPPPERVEPLAEQRVVVAPRVARESSLDGAGLGAVRPVAERRRDHRPRAVEQRLRMARDLGARHREPHEAEEPALASLEDVPLGVLVGGRRCGPDHVEVELLGGDAQLVGGDAACHP